MGGVVSMGEGGIGLSQSTFGYIFTWWALPSWNCTGYDVTRSHRGGKGSGTCVQRCGAEKWRISSLPALSSRCVSELGFTCIPLNGYGPGWDVALPRKGLRT